MEKLDLRFYLIDEKLKIPIKIHRRTIVSTQLCPIHNVPLELYGRLTQAFHNDPGCSYHTTTGLLLERIDEVTSQFQESHHVRPECQFEDCKLPASYDFLTINGTWAVGCTAHWVKFRVVKEMDPSKNNRLTDQNPNPPRPEGSIAEPTSKQPVIESKIKSQAKNRQETARKRKKLEFYDMVPGPAQKSFKLGSVPDIALKLCQRPEGTTLDEINREIKKIGPNHDALVLLIWMNKNRGWGFKKYQDRIKAEP